jgi:hypothetical protein
MLDDEMLSCSGNSCEGRKGMKKSKRRENASPFIHKVPTSKNTLNPDDITTLDPDDIIP